MTTKNRSSDSELLPEEEEYIDTWQARNLEAYAARTPEQLAVCSETSHGRHYWTCILKWQRDAPQELERIKASRVQVGTIDWENHVRVLSNVDESYKQRSTPEGWKRHEAVDSSRIRKKPHLGSHFH